jgi:hypothetical protein
MAIATTNSGSNDVAILYGKGDETFLSAIRFTAGDSPEALTAIDVDRNGRVDLVVLNQLTDSLTVLKNLLPDRYLINDLGTVSDVTIPNLSASNPANVVFEATAARNGVLTILAESVEIPGSVTVQLFDDNPFENPGATLVAESEATGSQTRLDYEFAEGGQSY